MAVIRLSICDTLILLGTPLRPLSLKSTLVFKPSPLSPATPTVPIWYLLVVWLILLFNTAFAAPRQKHHPYLRLTATKHPPPGHQPPPSNLGPTRTIRLLKRPLLPTMTQTVSSETTPDPAFAFSAKTTATSGQVVIRNGRIHLPNGDPVPNDGTGRGLQSAIDLWLAVRSRTHAFVPTAQTTLVCDAPPHLINIFKTRGLPIAQLEEITDSNDSLSIDDSSDSDTNTTEDTPDIFHVFATQKKKQSTKPSRIPEAEPAKVNESPELPTLPEERNKSALPPTFPTKKEEE
ncbi:hypothetical protein F5148DRAFT_1291798 [Russula earlei]|uniref:Uncharacterized protein n=1 Tax=Russula earlei TaxID=71964 RepID=A0ACC0TVJ8_9AGAM|nr:hypothetical protein F5148DRAFT_1291798 [Russula earlei]